MASTGLLSTGPVQFVQSVVMISPAPPLIF